ncbi:MAG: hypothetical protein ACRDGT_06790 [Candidatus Limnocylindria bacterium]
MTKVQRSGAGAGAMAEEPHGAELLTDDEREELRVARAEAKLATDTLDRARQQHSRGSLQSAQAADAVLLARGALESLEKSLRNLARDRMLPQELRQRGGGR